VNPKLVAVAGPLEGAVFPLSEEGLSVGRDPSNRLCIVDAAVSRLHCFLQLEAGRVKLTDLDSHNGTFVNGLPVKQRLLDPGDEIKIGDSLFLFLLVESDVTARPGPVLLDGSTLTTQTTAVLRREDALRLKPKKKGESIPEISRLSRDLNALLKVSTVLYSIPALSRSHRGPAQEAFQRQLLELLFEAVPAQRGAVLLVEGTPPEFTSVYVSAKEGGPDPEVRISRTIVQRVLGEKAAILSNHVLGNPAFSEAQSLLDLQVRSVLAVPMVFLDKVLGVIYLDTSDQKARFEEDHLQVLTATADIAAMALENARRLESLQSENRRLQMEIHLDQNLLGESPPMRELQQFIARVGPTDAPVLIGGEIGAGKELVARALHRNSRRADKPFVTIRCAGSSEALLEREIFGHEKDAFPGAAAQKKGKLEAAEGGALFLDEAGEIPLATQARLVRLLQERRFERVGGTRLLQADVRFLAASRMDLQEAVRARVFGEDLYALLSAGSVTVPPLRERLEDIPLLAGHFAARHSARSKQPLKSISPAARGCLMRYDWPGNVGELENVIERAVALSATGEITPADLPEAVLDAEPSPAAALSHYHQTIKEARKQLLRDALQQAGGNYLEAANRLGLEPNHLVRLLRSFHLQAEAAP